MRTAVFVVVLGLSFVAFSQSKSSDFERAAKQEEVVKSQKFKGLLKLYHVVFSEQILNDCIYEHSCSEFSQGAFDRFGFFKALMLTCDRLSRCNRTTLAETSRFRLTPEGKIKEEWDEY
ncbi:membrane protein insertion efficiency factor YidD [Marinoscillum furvescens]|uniref:Hemolytic domain-containing protein n=1 Tax=Marinoscillum furvescens DSM 4134 TaxID=1122208 RepID=A0A3D9KY84_MARFU|nr:membrane protein insertion efficiency factor YidD [Marinoscillum furvescens]RED93362.1 hemolytic domain-containing protein [Marinoscillum furvescens DSM 4134]